MQNTRCDTVYSITTCILLIVVVMNKPIMSTFVFLSLLFLIENTIASDVILSVVEGNSITIPGGGIRIDKIHAVSWFKGEKVYQYQQVIVHSNNRQSGRFSIVNSYGDLMIQNVSRDDAGYYTVQVIESGEELSETNTYHLDVYYMDFSTLTSNTKDNTDSKYIIFHCHWCEIHPKNEPKVTWIHNGNILDTKTKIIKYNVVKEGRSNTLVVYQVSESDFGRYACRVTVETTEGIMSKTSNIEEITRALDSTSPTGISTTVLILAVIASIAIGSFLTCVVAGFLYKRRVGLKGNKSKDNDLQYQDMQYASPPSHYQELKPSKK